MAVVGPGRLWVALCVKSPSGHTRQPCAVLAFGVRCAVDLICAHHGCSVVRARSACTLHAQLDDRCVACAWPGLGGGVRKFSLRAHPPQAPVMLTRVRNERRVRLDSHSRVNCRAGVRRVLCCQPQSRLCRSLLSARIIRTPRVHTAQPARRESAQAEGTPPSDVPRSSS